MLETWSAKNAIMRLIQQKHFGDLLNFLSNDPFNLRLKHTEHGKNDSVALRGDKKTVRAQINKLGAKLVKLDPVLHEDSFLRVGSRLVQSDLPFQSRHQIILPSDEPIVRSLLVFLHESEGHCGREYLHNLTKVNVDPRSEKID